MDNRFENFTVTVLKLNKLVQKIKLREMGEYGLKAVHVMCIYYLDVNRGGLTASELVKLTLEDKAAISRALGVLRTKGYVSYDHDRYGAPIFLTGEGEKVARFINERSERAVAAAGRTLSDGDREIMYKSLLSVADNLKKYYDDIVKENQ